MTGSDSSNIQRFFLHYPHDRRVYICFIDQQRRVFDFTDGSFRERCLLSNARDACLYADGRDEVRADHEYSYSVDFDLSRLTSRTDTRTLSQEEVFATIHWFDQLGDEPDVAVDKHLGNSCSLKCDSGRLVPANKWDRDALDEEKAFERRATHEREHWELCKRELDEQVVRQKELSAAVKSGKLAEVLRVLAKDITAWAGNLKQHVLHQVTHLAKDPFFVSTRNVPEGSPFQVHEFWAVREWLGAREAYDLLEFHRGVEYANRFSERLERLHTARVELSKSLIEYTVTHRGEDMDGLVALDEQRKSLKKLASELVEYLHVITYQFAPVDGDEQIAGSVDEPASNVDNASGADVSAKETGEECDASQTERASNDILRLALPNAVMSALALRDLLRIRYYYPSVMSDEEATRLQKSLMAELLSSVSTCKLESTLSFLDADMLNDAGTDMSLSTMAGILAAWHPDFKVDPSSPDVSKALTAAFNKCETATLEPVKSLVERVSQAILVDCRVPRPVDDPTYDEPQRFLQMLRHYWSLIRQLVLHHIEALVSFRPHPLTPLVVNLKARIVTCFDRLGNIHGAIEASERVDSLIEIVLSAEPDDLQVAPEWSYEQVGSIDRFLEEARLVLGAKSYPLTFAEESCIRNAQAAIQTYEGQVKEGAARVFRKPGKVEGTTKAGKATAEQPVSTSGSTATTSSASDAASQGRPTELGAEPASLARILRQLVDATNGFLDSGLSSEGDDPDSLDITSIKAGGGIHSAIVELQKHYGGKLPSPEPRNSWLKLQATCRRETDPVARQVAAHDFADELREWATKQLEAAVKESGDKPTGISIASWSEFAVGLDENNTVYAFISPPPSCGDRVTLGQGIKLRLPGARWKAVLQCFANSTDGRRARKSDLVTQLGYAKGGGRFSDDEIMSDGLRISANIASRKLSSAMADLSRQLRQVVDCPESPVFSSEGDEYHSGFIVRALLRDENRQIRFGDRR